jgi:hypothetical protein
VNSRKNVTGCPKCYEKNRGKIRRKAALKKSGSLAEKNPSLAKQWHPFKNKDLTPCDVTPGSKRKVWWKCDKGHDYTATVNNRKSGWGCPHCSGRYPSKEYNLAVKYPDLMKEWHPIKNNELTPYDVVPGSHEKVWWICPYGHEWLSTVGSRALRGRGCPSCHPSTSRIEIRLFCELKTIFEDVKWGEEIGGDECDVYLPKYGVGVEIDGYWHRGRVEKDRQKGNRLLKKGVEVFRIRDNRLRKVSQTDIFYRKSEPHYSVIERILNHLTKNIVFKQEDQLKITTYLKLQGLQNKQEYKKLISILPKPLPDKSLTHLYPRLAKEWNYEKNTPLEPNMFTPGSNKKVWWKCEKGHEWEAIINSRKDGRNCPYCAGKKASKEYNLAIKYPELSKQWHITKNKELTPYDVTPGSNEKVWWTCDQGHEWKATVKNRALLGSGCRKCYHERRRPK